jgi:hypothetical protein
MATEAQNTFIKNIANAVKTYMGTYGIKVASPIIAQAIHESNWGKSSLASKYHNYFGLKCGSKWAGKSVNMTTKEEYKAGTLTTIKDNFRVYDNLNAGVKGYFDFINNSRYSNLKGVTDPEKYVENLKADGYATDSKYVSKIMNYINLYNLTQYDSSSSTSSSSSGSTTASKASTSATKTVSEIAKEVVAGKWGNGTERKKKLEAAGYNYAAIQAEVNKLVASASGTSTTSSASKTNEAIAKEVIAGKWGNGTERKKKLEAAGYNYAAIQALVNKLAK